jgi:LacI family transcriptional regulator
MAESIAQKLIAEKAGVSRTTVSVVLNNRPTPVISEKTRRRVLKVAQTMGYRPRPKISYPTGTHNLGIFASRGPLGIFANSFYAQVFDGIQQEAAQNGFHLIFAMPENRLGRTGPTLLTENKCDGALLVGPVRERILEAVRADQTPAVAVGESPAEIESVVADQARAARLAVEHFVARGHRQLAYLGTDLTSVCAHERYDAFRLALLDHGLELHREWVLEVPGDADGGEQAIEQLLPVLPQFTAILCANDATAFGVIARLRLLGKRVPEDYSIIGTDDVPEARRANLTTIAVPKEDLGRLAVKKLLGKIAGDDTPANRSVVPVVLLERGSVAPRTP